MKLPSFLTDLSISPVEYHRLALEWCKKMRQAAPVLYDEHEEVWLVFRYDDAVRVRGDYKTFSSENMLANGRGGRSIISMDPPRHRQLRSLITQAFSARTIAQMAPQIEHIVDELIDRVQAKGAMDWMSDLANPLPVMVISDMLGLPREEWRQFKAWTDALMSFNSEAMQAQQHFVPYFAEAIEERRKAPGNDILSLLIAAEIEGERLSYPDLMSFCFTLFIAGNITTTNTLGNAILCFDQHPEELELLRWQPELAASAVEEVLRTMPPGRVGPNGIIDGRTVTSDVELGGRQLRKGDRVITVSLSNNFDESQFSDPERFDIGRHPNHHLSFGYGIHFCIGAPLARLEMKTVLSKMVQRLPDLHLLHDEPLQVVDSRIMFGPKRLPVAFRAV